MKTLELNWMVGAFIFVVLVVTAIQMITLPVEEAREWGESGKPCEGEALKVNYPYDGEMLNPHECQKQCDDETAYYILYSDGQATQCDKLPKCNDWGEDFGITCKPLQA